MQSPGRALVGLVRWGAVGFGAGVLALGVQEGGRKGKAEAVRLGCGKRLTEGRGWADSGHHPRWPGM